MTDNGKQWELIYPYFEYNESFRDNSTPWAGHKCFGYNLIRNFEPGLVVELGSWKGTSFFSFCQAVKDIKSNTKLVAIDTWAGDSHAGHVGDRMFNDFKAILSKHYSGISANYIRKSFNDAVNDFEDHTIDILHIDGYHTYQAVSNDFNTWKIKVKEDGIIIFHDISERKDDFEVYKFWDEIKKQYKTCLEFSHSHGLGILFLDEAKYKFAAQNFESDKVKYLEFSYQLTKAELFDNKAQLNELAAIKASRYWRIKEAAKKILLRR